MDCFFTCAYCFQINELFIDVDAGGRQRYVEDCQVCCRPNLLTLTWNDDLQTYEIECEPES